MPKAPAGPLPDLLTDLLGPEVEEARRVRREERTRLAAYLDDLAAVLRAGGGAGVRVLRHWLDAACANDRLSRPEPAIHGAAALYDYARDRTAEIAMADPASLLRIRGLAWAAAARFSPAVRGFNCSRAQRPRPPWMRKRLAGSAMAIFRRAVAGVVVEGPRPVDGGLWPGQAVVGAVRVQA